MKKYTRNVALFCMVFAGIPASVYAELHAGDKVQTLSNLHPDLSKSLLYTMNYQLPDVIPVCETVLVKNVKRKRMIFEWKGREFTIAYDKHTKKAGVSFQESLSDYFGPKCDKKKIDGLGKKDREGIRTGQPAVGMTKAGILFAMGRPPRHVNPNLESQKWMYWLNRFKRKAILFDERGNVTRVKL